MKSSLFGCFSLILIVACGGGSGSNDNDPGIGGLSKKLIVNTFARHCATKTPFSNGEILVHNDDGSVSQRVNIAANGITEIGSDLDLLNLSVMMQKTNYQGETSIDAVSYYQLPINNEIEVQAYYDYSNVPASCICQDASMTLYNDTMNAYTNVSSDDYVGQISSNGNSNMTILGLCGASGSHADILALVTDKATQSTYWSQQSYPVGSDTYLQFDPYENQASRLFNISVDEDADDLYFSNWNFNSDLWHGFWYNSTEGLGHFIPEISGFNIQTAYSIKYMFNEPNHWRTAIARVQRGASDLDIALSMPIVNDFTVTLDQSSGKIDWTVDGDFSASELYVWGEVDSVGAFTLFAPTDMHDIYFPQYPPEYGISASQYDYLTLRIRRYGNNSSYSENVMARLSGNRYFYEIDSLRESYIRPSANAHKADERMQRELIESSRN